MASVLPGWSFGPIPAQRGGTRKAHDSGFSRAVTNLPHICMLFFLTWRPPLASNSLNMKHLNLMPTNIWTASLTLAGVAALATGCAERRVEYVPVYHVQPAYAGQPVYAPPPQPPPNSVTGAAPTADWQQPPPAPAPVPMQPPPQTVVVAPSAPPAALVEVIPYAPDPTYVWAPGYYTWNGGWVWVGGRYIVRPRPGVVWVGGHWGRHGRGYVWIGGGWR